MCPPANLTGGGLLAVFKILQTISLDSIIYNRRKVEKVRAFLAVTAVTGYTYRPSEEAEPCAHEQFL